MPKKRTLYLSIAELKELGLIKKYLRKKRKNKKKQKLAVGNTIQPYQGYNGIKSVSEMQSSYNQINRNNDIDNAIKYKLLENAEKQVKSKEQMTEEEFKAHDKLKSDLESFNKFLPVFEDYTQQTDRNFIKTGEMIHHINNQIIKPYTLERNQDGNFFQMPDGDLYDDSGVRLGGVNIFDTNDTPQSSNSDLFLPEGETQWGQLSVSGQGINNAINNTEGTPQTPVSQTPVPQTPPNTVPLQQQRKNDIITAEDQALFTSLKNQALELAHDNPIETKKINVWKKATDKNIQTLRNKIIFLETGK